MNTIAALNPTAQRSPLPRRVVERLRLSWRRWRTYERVCRELYGCSDRDLAELKIGRYEIPRLARETAAREV